MTITPQQLLPFIGTTITIGGLIFKGGQMSEKLEVIGWKVEAQEKKNLFNNEKICEIHSDVTILKNDIAYIKEDLHEMKIKLDNLKK
jgi:hypothetical protein